MLTRWTRRRDDSRPAAGRAGVPPRRLWPLWLLLPLAGLLAAAVFLGALALLFYATRRPLELQPAERALVLDIRGLAGWTDYAPDLTRESTHKLRYADGSIEIEYEYEIPDDARALYLSYSVSLEPDLGRALSGFDLMWQATAVGLTLSNGSDLALDERNDLFSWGDSSRFAIIRVGDRGAGNLFVGRLGTRVVHCMFSGVVFEDPQAIAALLLPALHRLERFSASPRAIGATLPIRPKKGTMPLEIQIDGADGTAIAIATGDFSMAEMKAGAQSVWSHPGFGGSRVLWDLRRASFSLTPDEVAQLAAFARSASPLRPPARMAFVVSHDLTFGLIRMWESLRESPGIETRVVRDYEEARSWIDGA